MRKYSIKGILVLVLTFLIAETSYANTIELTEEEKDFVSSHPVLNVVSDPYWPPMEYYNTADKIPQYSGFTVEYLKYAGEQLGITFNFLPVKDYKSSIQSILKGRADIITGYTSRLSMSDSINFSDILFEVPLVLASATGEQPVPGDKILVPQISGDELEKFQELYSPHLFEYSFYETPQSILAKFNTKGNRFIVVNSFELYDFATDIPYTVYPLNISYLQNIGISKNLGDSAVSVINKAFHSISEESFENIVLNSQTQRKWYQNNLETQKKTKIHFTIYLLGTILLILALMSFIFVRLYRKKVDRIEFDDITGTPTFSKFKHEVRKILKKAKPDEYMLLSFNIDNFKFINDSFGFAKGNLLLVELASHFMDECREGELVCRNYADNFVFFGKNPGLLPLIEDRVFQLSNVSDHIKKLLPEKYQLTFSTSVYYIHNTREDITVMLDKANLARKLGKNNFATHRVIEYTQEMNEDNEWKKEVTMTMEKAIEECEFKVYYQPKFRFSDAKIVGAEALIRWNNPEKGLLPPDKFIPLFEHNGFIQKIDFYVFENVCRFLDNWNRMGKNEKCPEPLTISFNLSRYHLYNPELINELNNIVNRYKISPSKIEVELTETIMFDNQKRLIRTMNDIKKAGFSISVDDFGSGYSSLNLLKDMPADVLKLDKEFLSNVPESTKESIIINSIIDMAKKLHMVTVAEGVETKVQSDLLRDMGCDVAQGFYYAKPMPEEDFEELLEKSFLTEDSYVAEAKGAVNK